MGARARPFGCLCPGPERFGLRNSLRSNSPRPHIGFGTGAQPRQYDSTPPRFRGGKPSSASPYPSATLRAGKGEGTREEGPRGAPPPLRHSVNE